MRTQETEKVKKQTKCTNTIETSENIHAPKNRILVRSVR